MEKEPIEIPKPQGYHCFACGTANPIGLRLKFYKDGDRVFTDITLDKNYEGWENVAHGGIVSTLLDEVMAYAVMFSKQVFIVTRNMTIKYIRPVLIGTPLTVMGRLSDDSQPPKITAISEIRNDKGNLLVRSSAEFVEVPGEKLSPVTERLKQDMLSLFQDYSSIP